MSVERTINFLVSLCFYKRNAPYVWSLTILFATTFYPITKPRSTLETLKHMKRLGNPIKFIGFRNVLQNNMTLLATALKLLTNLQTLELRLRASDGRDENVAHLLGQTTFQLRKFGTTMEFNSEMGRFLRNQNQLRELQCSSSLTSAILTKNLLPSGTLPKLSIITWSSRLPMNVVRYITSERPIEKVTVLVETEVPNLAPLLDIGPRSESVKQVSLMINSNNITAEQVGEIAVQFPAAQELGMKMRKLDENFLTQITASIHHFKSLRRLILSANAVVFKRWEDLIQEHLAVCFEKCKTLSYLIFPVTEKDSIKFYVFRRR
ncbi:hypothetical protein CPB84DRAFT_1781645 [Gymnopilus junonius]|uniref:Uncharacterized protein n=1 Tax=Gymnopilus junonius TaxID=109634 RepID=A0A9P5NNM3_GYMJU|nr:hypothetical protein CPB84DRAFT_1781645 [Gymnopilus junonius]